jgi:hypothetical protein
LNFQTVTLCADDIDFDFTQFVYWIEAEVSRSDAAQLAELGMVQIVENSGTCPP